MAVLSARRQFLICVLFVMSRWLPARTPTDIDASYRVRVETVDSLFRRAREAQKRGTIRIAEYRAIVRLLREEETAIAREAKEHRFKNITESNYWHRGRLKFPTALQQEIEQNQKP